MKKILALILTLVMVLSLTACGGSGEGSSESGEGGSSSSEGGSAEKIKIDLLVQQTGDRSYNDSAASGIEMINSELGDYYEGRVVEYGLDTTKVLDAVYEAADGDADIIIIGTFTNIPYIEEVAPLYPDKKFVLYDSSVDYEGGDYSNVASIGYSVNEGSFLAGMAAAYFTESDHEKANADATIGFVGGVEGPVIYDFLVGYIQGAQYVNPDIKVLQNYAGDYVNSGKAKELSLQQITEGGADVMFQVAGGAGIGTIEAAYDEGIPAIGVDADQAAQYEGRPEQDTIMTSSLKEVGNSIFALIEADMNGTAAWGEYTVMSFDEEAVGIVYNDILSSYISEEQIAEIEAAREMILSGDIEVMSAWTTPVEEVEAFVAAAAE